MKKIGVLEVISLVFANWLLISCTVLSYWLWRAVFCDKLDYGCQNITGVATAFTLFGCALPFILWIIFTSSALITSQPSNQHRIDAISIGIKAIVVLALLWLIGGILAFQPTAAIVTSLLCGALVISDILYVIALIKDNKCRAY